MNLSIIEAFESMGAQEDPRSSRSVEIAECQRLWSPEDIAEPDSWTLASFDEPTRRAVHAEYLRSIEPYRNGAAYRIPGEFVAAVGVKPS